jgi:hypothetical protein
MFGGERGEVSVERILGSDLAYEVAGGGALRVRSNQSEKLAEGGGSLVLGEEGFQSKLD